MKKIISIISVVILAVLINACSEDKFLRVNTDANAMSIEDLKADLGFGTRFASLLNNLHAAQTGEDLTYDHYVRHMGTNTDFLGNSNNTTYTIEGGWNNQMWNTIYDNVMGPAHQIKKLAEDAELPLFYAWADLLQLYGLTKATVYYGPLIYSEYGILQDYYEYDTEKELYEQFFEKLDVLQAEFAKHLNDPVTTGQLTKFDTSTLKGDLAKWLQMINSLRLRLAVRISKADPITAKREGEKAMSDPVGLILTNANNFARSLNGGTALLWTMSESWNDTRMGAGLEEVLVGLKDPRAHAWFQPAEAAVIPAGRDAEWPYKGVSGGSFISSGKGQREAFSRVSNNFAQPNWNIKMYIDAAEVNFALAEARLRGWSGSIQNNTVQYYYEEGVKRSWEFWQDMQKGGKNGHKMMEDYDVDAYLNDDTSMPLPNIVDVFDARNNYTSRMIDPDAYTVKWNDGVGPERKLERIILQKWIAAYNNANEVWSDHRRTGYPKLSFNRKNDKNTTVGVVEDNDFLKRMPFTATDKNVNLAFDPELQLPQSKLGGPDLINTPLWIHTPWVDHSNPDNKLP